MSTRYTNPIVQLGNDDATDVGSGWKLNFYLTGTSTRKDTFSDNALTSTNANPVVADSSGRFADIFYESGTYKVVLTDADDVQIWSADPVDGSLGTGGAVLAKTAAYTVVAGDQSKVIAVDASSGALTTTLLAAATAGDGFEIIVKKTDSSTNAVTVDANGAETIDNKTTYVLGAQDHAVTLRCDGTSWHVTGDRLERNSKGADVASASPCVLGTDGNYFDITGTTGFSAFTVGAGTLFTVQFDGILTMTHGASINLPGGVNAVTAAGDEFTFYATAKNVVRCIGYALDSGISHQVNVPVYSVTGGVATGTTVMVNDDTTPQNTEGDQYMTLAITPRNTLNLLKIEVVVNAASSAVGRIIVALFQDSTASALGSAMTYAPDTNELQQVSFVHWMVAGTISSTTFKVRAGNSEAGTTTFNGVAAGRILGGVMTSSITITEYTP